MQRVAIWLTASLLLAISGAGGGGAFAQSILEPRLDPASPATLAPGQRVEVAVRFRAPAGPGVRIFVAPETGGRPTPGSWVSGSGLFEPGRGTARASFTVREGAAKVDALRLTMTDAGTGAVVGEIAVPVDYRFRPQASAEHPARPPAATRMAEELPERIAVRERPAVERPTIERPTIERPTERVEISPELIERLGTYRPPAWRLPERSGPSGDRGDEGESGVEGGEGDADSLEACFVLGIEANSCERVAERKITPEGDVIVRCEEGGSWTTPASGGTFYTAPDGRRCSRSVLFSTALPPAEPPEGIGDSEWASQVNAWLGGVSQQLLDRIGALVGPADLQNYQALEADRANDLYQRVDLRLSYLDLLMEQL